MIPLTHKTPPKHRAQTGQHARRNEAGQALHLNGHPLLNEMRPYPPFACPGRHCVGVGGAATTHRIDALGVIHTLGMPMTGREKPRAFR